MDTVSGIGSNLAFNPSQIVAEITLFSLTDAKFFESNPFTSQDMYHTDAANICVQHECRVYDHYHVPLCP